LIVEGLHLTCKKKYLLTMKISTKKMLPWFYVSWTGTDYFSIHIKELGAGFDMV
jgi:hypothetical protein